MKNSKLFILLITFLFPILNFAQKNNDVKITIKEKGKKAQINTKYEILPHFIQFGIMSRSHDNFKNKYKIDIVYENCVITTFLSNKAKENNLAIAKLLTEKYGDTWKKDLEIIPYGL